MIRSSPGKGAVVLNPRQVKGTTHRHRLERGGIPSDRVVTRGSQVPGPATTSASLVAPAADPAAVVDLEDLALVVEAVLEGLVLVAAASSNAHYLFKVMSL